MSRCRQQKQAGGAVTWTQGPRCNSGGRQGSDGAGPAVHLEGRTPDLIIRPSEDTRLFKQEKCHDQTYVSRRSLWLVRRGALSLTTHRHRQRTGEWGTKVQASPHQVHDDENTFPGCCSGLSPTVGCCQGQLGTGTSKTGSDGNLVNSLRLQAWVTIITQHPVVISRQ